jgi:hypothetical protein
MGILKTKIPMLGPRAIYLTVEDLSGSGDAPGKPALAAGGARARSIEGGDQGYGSSGYENFVELKERISMQNGRGLCFLHAEIFGN